MKVTKRILLSAGLLLAGAVALPAQNLKADIPFDFYVGETKLAAGTYNITQAADLQGHLYRLRERRSTASTLAAFPIPAAAYSPAVKDTKMLFRCAQNECELHELWIGATGTKLRAGRSKRFDGVHTEIATVLLKYGM